jgi:hypothetical protein
MAMTLLSVPESFDSAHGDLVYVAYNSSNYTQQNYKYICDIYIGGTLITTLKAYPNPATGHGIFNIGNVVRNYVSSQFAPDLTKNVWVQNYASYFASVQCKIGEEYGVPIVATTNLYLDDTRFFGNNYNGRLVGVYSNLIPYLNSWATNRPTNTNVLLGSNVVMMPILRTYIDVCSNQVTLNVSVTSLSGTTTTNSKVLTTFTLASNQMNQFNVSPQAINNEIGSSIITSNTKYYQVYFTLKDTECNTITLPTKRFYIYCESRYTPLTLIWLNKQGGYDSYDFSKVSKKAYDIDKKTYTQLNYKINSSTGVMSYYNQTTLNDNMVTYSGTFKERLVANTDIIDEATYAWLGELVNSPAIYLQSGTYFIPMIIKNTSFDFKTKVVDRQFNLQLNLEYGDVLNVQYR